MTLIAYKDGILCADSLRTQNELKLAQPYLKIARRKDGALFCSAGNACVNREWMRWFLDGEHGPPPWRDESQTYDNIAIIAADKSYRLWSEAKEPDEFEGEAFGFGYSIYLHGIMDAGMGAADAVKIGCRRYTWADYPLIEIGHSGDPVIWLGENRKGNPGEFFKLCGVDGDYFIQKRDDPATALGGNS